MVWDGDQILHEISAPGWTGAGALMQRDTGLVVRATYINTTSDARRITFPKQAYRGFFYGRVMYTHGGGIDKPLSLTRSEYSDSLYSPATIFPTADWRGSYDYGTGIPCGQILVQKRLQSQHTEPGLPDTVPTTYENHCYAIDWPAPHVLITRVRKDKDYLGEMSWMGSLLNEQRDASGQMYRRNRYYDPASGRFTQEDPIGIAGGLNVYGYANGDPVGYSDPYGLCPGRSRSGTICIAFYIQTETTLFGQLKGDGRGPSPYSSPSQSRAYVIVDPSNPGAARPVINPTCNGDGSGCEAPSSSNSLTITPDGEGGFTLDMDLVNSKVPRPQINANIRFSPDGKGGYKASGTRDGYPSAEAYYYRKDGSVQTLFNQKEGNPRELWGTSDKKVP